MQIYGEDGRLLETAPDYEKGRLEYLRQIVKEHPAVKEVPEVNHLEVMEGTEGLRTVVIDSPYVPGKEAWTEYETVGIYHPYTAQELAERNKPGPEERLEAAEAAILELAAMLGGAQV